MRMKFICIVFASTKVYKVNGGKGFHKTLINRRLEVYYSEYMNINGMLVQEYGAMYFERHLKNFNGIQSICKSWKN